METDDPMAMTWTDQLMDVGGTRLHLRRAGPSCGPASDPVVILHDAGAESVDAPAWELVAACRPVVQIMLPGVGESPRPPTGVDMSWVTDLLAGAVRELCQGPVVLVGTSLGGWFALELALAHPQVVGPLLLLDIAGLHSSRGYLFGLFTDGQGQAGHDGLLRPLLQRHRAPDEPQATQAYITTMTAAAMLSWSPYVMDPSLLARVGRLRSATTIMWGERDALIPLTHGQALAKAMPDAELVVVADAGHLLAIDAAEQVSRRLILPRLPSASQCPSRNTD
ncbi:MAG: alpha/beta fold hydrolase [Euzebya sp.]